MIVKSQPAILTDLFPHLQLPNTVLNHSIKINFTGWITSQRTGRWLHKGGGIMFIEQLTT